MRPTKAVLAAILLIAPASLMAQDRGAEDASARSAPKSSVGGLSDNPRLGLLGLLGLGGLIGLLLRREPNIHVDARREKRD